MLTLVLKSCHLKLSISLNFETKVLTLLTLQFSKNCNKITKFFLQKSIFSSLVYTLSKIFILTFCQIFSNLSPLVHFLISFVLKLSHVVQIYLYLITSILSTKFHEHWHWHRHRHKTWACTWAQGTGIGTNGKVRLILEISKPIFFFFSIQSRVQYFVSLIILLQNP